MNHHIKSLLVLQIEQGSMLAGPHDASRFIIVILDVGIQPAPKFEKVQ